MSAGQDLIRAMNTLRQARRAAGRSQEDVGAAIGRSQSTVAKLEGAHGVPDVLESFFKLAAELGCCVTVERVFRAAPVAASDERRAA